MKQSPSTIIRQLNAEDLEPVSDLVETTFHTFVADHFTQQGIETFLNFIDPRTLAARWHAGALFLVAEQHHIVAGVLEMKNHRHITLLFTDARYQQQGIASLLLNTAITLALQHNPGLTEITVNATPNALSIYKRMGFAQAKAEQLFNGIRFTPMTKPV